MGTIPLPIQNLNDDQVKLVEYTLLTIERQHERLLEGPKQTLVTDNLTGDAFSNARVAEWFKRTGGRVTDGVDGRTRQLDLDTLRVFYKVLDRWPKEDLKFDERSLSYDRQKVNALREIRDALPGWLASRPPGRGRVSVAKKSASAPATARDARGPGGRRFARALNALSNHRGLLMGWREEVRSNAERLAKAIVAAFAKTARVGHFETLELDADEVAAALSSKVSSSAEDFDKTAGSWRLDSRTFSADGAEVGRFSAFAVLDASRQLDGGSSQRVAITPTLPFDFETESAATAEAPTILAYQDEEIGLSTWMSQQGASKDLSQAEALTGFSLGNDRYLWIGQRESGDALSGSSDHYLVSLVWQGEHEDQRAFFQVPLDLRIDFGRGRVEAGRGPVTKNLHVMVEETSPAGTAFADAQGLIENNGEIFKAWRDFARRNAGAIADAVVEIFSAGDGERHVKVFQLDSDQVAEALRRDYDFKSKDFDQFSGSFTSDARSFDETGAESNLGATYSVRSGAQKSGAAMVQRVVVSTRADASLDAVSASDTVALGYASPELGQVTVFNSLALQNTQALAAFQLSATRYLWIGQETDAHLKPLDDDVYLVSLVWRDHPRNDFNQVSSRLVIDESGTVATVGSDVVMIANQAVEATNSADA